MKILEIHLLSDDLIQTEEFYSGLLSIPVLHKTETGLTFSVGATKLCFTKSENLQPVYHLAIDIPHNKVREAYTWLQKRTALLPVTGDSNIADFTNWNAKSFYFYDNNGNILELIARFSLSNASDNPFDSASFLSVSEVGIVTDDVPGLAEKIISEYGLGIFAKQPAHENFTVLGDDEGLCILVSENRPWFPTDKPAAFFPAKIVFAAADDSPREMTLTKETIFITQ